MCGIAGFFALAPAADRHLAGVEAIVERQRHRGPEFQQTLRVSPSCILGHDRLAIVDLKPASNQPMVFQNRYWIVYNGEVFNFRELRAELAADFTFQTDGDTEVILAAWTKWGPDCQHRFNGMWAFALYDARDNELWLCRDRFGIKPLYYTEQHGGIYFSSEVQAIHKSVCPDRPYFQPVLQVILSGSLEAHARPETWITGINSLPPGAMLRCNASGSRLSTWYSPERVAVPAAYPDRVAHFRSLFEDAIQLRVMADVPAATCLSGGLDSSSIVAYIHHLRTEGRLKATNYRHISFNAAFPDSFLDETAFASDLAGQLGLELDIVPINPPTPERLIRAVKAMDGPMHSLAFFPTYELFGEIKRRGITVSLDGQGPDELLGGYITRKVFETAVESALFRFDLPRMADVSKTYKALALENDVLRKQPFSARQHVRFVAGALRRRQRPLRSLQDSFLKHSVEQFFHTPMLTILQQVDRCSMAHAVECRMPFMDYRIVEFILSLPDSDKLGAGQTKRIVRDAMTGILPDSIRLRRNKIGFNAPLNEWMTGSLRTFTLDTLQSRPLLENSNFDGRTLQRSLTKAIESGKVTWGDAWDAWPKLHLVLQDGVV